jgi:ribosome-associated protein
LPQGKLITRAAFITCAAIIIHHFFEQREETIMADYKNRKVKIKDEYIKLDSLLKLADAVSTGGQAKQLVQDGAVRFNGEICTMRGKKCRPGDVITLLDVTITVE